jgi:hypothetical protein
MALFLMGEAVIVAGRGPGVVTDIIGGPRGPMYRVTLTQDDNAYGAFTSYTTVEEEAITAATAIPVYSIGDKVLYQSRVAEVTAYDAESTNTALKIDPPLPDPNIEVDGSCYVVIPAWKIYLQQIKA